MVYALGGMEVMSALPEDKPSSHTTYGFGLEHPIVVVP